MTISDAVDVRGKEIEVHGRICRIDFAGSKLITLTDLESGRSFFENTATLRDQLRALLIHGPNVN